ncbi:MAG: SprT-like domain-containing protein [Paludibacteraceae bacterium]|nr:SprT-like domain-containing protein [Paludibacteraceae bacterium]
MIPTIDYIQTRFDEYNERFFNGSLPPIPIRLSHAKGFLGKVTFTRKPANPFALRPFARYQNTDFVLRINVRIDLPQEVVDDTILHEMIHYYIAVNQWNDTSTHGRLFRREMARINREGNRHITISHRLSDAEQAQAHIRKGRVVAIVTFADGRTGVKVLPKQIRHILAWDKQARRTFAPSPLRHSSINPSPITNIEWYYTDDGYFAKYPSSTALRIYLIDDISPFASDHSPLQNAHRLSLADGKVRLILNPDNNLRW